MNWKISRIEISSFKAFKHIILNVDGKSLLTLDGPNGFGKTSIFDAIELLLTGRIARIERLFDKLIPGQQVIYEDNLYWNTRSLDSDLCIKIEFTDKEESFVLARKASCNILENKRNNKANNFTYFLLYKLKNFESEEYITENICSDAFISKNFGESIKDNYSLLNYLEQGQNEYLFSTGICERKNQLESLIRTTEINEEIEKCKSVERKIIKFINQPDRMQKKKDLEEKLRVIHAVLSTDLDNTNYERISTTDNQPAWDKEEFVTTYSKEFYTECLTKVQKIIDLHPLKSSIASRIHNNKIDKFLIRERETIRALVQLGKNTKKIFHFDEQIKSIDSLNLYKSILQKDINSINQSDIEIIESENSFIIEKISKDIQQRDILLKKIDRKSVLTSEIIELKKELMRKKSILTPDDSFCPVCGTDWKSHERLLSALENKNKELSDNLDNEGNLLLLTCRSITENIDILLEEVNRTYVTVSYNYDRALHQALLRNRERIGQIEALASRLEKINIHYDDGFTMDEEEIDRRLEILERSILTQKKDEKISLPENWESTIKSAFEKTEDFYTLEINTLEMKKNYIFFKENESKNNTIIEIKDELLRHTQKNIAANRVKENIAKLKESLVKIEKSYADQTISEIELIFHIYSGRLIQNYQRGLGLFIESKEGKQLRFTTAEKSEHDSILSMSSGQISAISLAFFFALNKVYAKTSMILIDDPSQSLDEINIASLTDLLRCELRDRQLIVSSHEEDISTYMRYRFSRAGLSSKTINMQNYTRKEST